MRKFLRILLAVLFCTTAMCICDVNANTNTSDNAGKASNVTIQDSIQNVKSTVINSNTGAYSDEEVYLAAQLVHHEAHNQAYNGKVGVAEVVLNRVKSELFPNSIESVIFQSGQFTSVRRLKNINPTDMELRIAYNVLNGNLRVFNDEDVLYFRNPKVTSGISAEIDKNWGDLDYVTHIGDHAFYSQDAQDNIAEQISPVEKKKSFWDKLPNSISIAKFFSTKKNIAKKDVSAKNNAEDVNVVDTNQAENEPAIQVEYQTTENVAEEAEVLLDADGNVIDVNNMTEEQKAYMDAKQLENVLSAQYYAQKAALESTLESNNSDLEVTEVKVSEADDVDSTDEILKREVVNVDATVLMAQAQAMTLAMQKSGVEDELDEEIDENDPVAVARRQALLNERAEREAREKKLEEERKAVANAQEQAVISDQMHVERVARHNEEVAKATQAAVDKVLASQAK